MKKYPLIEHAAHEIRTADGRPLSEITLEAAAAGHLSARDLLISSETLDAQARIAQEAGYPQLGSNLARAAELSAVSGEELLRIYEILRPGRASYEELLALACKLEDQYQAPENARLVREAAGVYRARGLLRHDP
jgi:propanediol dehydratase small subunit